MGGLYFKSGKDACISFKLWDIGQWVLQILVEKILTESIKRKANLKWRTLKLLLKNFYFWEFFNLGRLPMRIRPPEKSLYFSTTFQFPLLRQCISYPTSFWVLFERAFEPSTIIGSAFPILPPFERAFEPSSYFFSSAPSSPRPS